MPLFNGGKKILTPAIKVPVIKSLLLQNLLNIYVNNGSTKEILLLLSKAILELFWNSMVHNFGRNVITQGYLSRGLKW